MSEKETFDAVSYHKIDDFGDGQRVDNYLFKILKGVPKSHIYQVIRKGNVRVNKKRVDASDKLRWGDEIRLPPVRVSEREPVFIADRQIDLIKKSILYEDDGFIIINKPSGLPVHGGTEVSFGVIDLLRLLFPQCKQLELAHRLDKETSGCLIVAKKTKILREFHELFRAGQVTKTYSALCQGWWKPGITTVDLPLLKNHLQSGERMVVVHREGKTAISHFKVIEKFPDASLVEVGIDTGRTHQIRVHASYSGHPIASDQKYGDKQFNARIKGLGLGRLFLHASEVSFTLPALGRELTVKASLPSELTEVLERLRAN